MTHTFNKRELKTLDAVCRGWPNKQIALALNISVYTVKHRVHALMDKTGMSTRLELAMYMNKPKPAAAAKVNPVQCGCPYCLIYILLERSVRNGHR